MYSNQLPEVAVGFAGPPHPQRISKLSRKYCAVWKNIPVGWWLNHDVCKYIVSCLIHKDNKDIMMKPTQQPPGHSRLEARGRKEKALEVERAVAKADRPVEKYGDVDHLFCDRYHTLHKIVIHSM